jgi:glutaredoxin-related protein
MTMKAESSGFSVQDVLFIIGLQLCTGELVLESGNNIGTMLLHEGKILQAFSQYSRAIGDLLVEDGIITETELLDTLKFQKKSASSPLGGLFLKIGKVAIEIIEMLVHQQIRQSMKEFQSWKDFAVTFVDKDVKPYDGIHLTTHEFISPETLRSAETFLSTVPSKQTASPPATSSLP